MIRFKLFIIATIIIASIGPLCSQPQITHLESCEKKFIFNGDSIYCFVYKNIENGLRYNVEYRKHIPKKLFREDQYYYKKARDGSTRLDYIRMDYDDNASTMKMLGVIIFSYDTLGYISKIVNYSKDKGNIGPWLHDKNDAIYLYYPGTMDIDTYYFNKNTGIVFLGWGHKNKLDSNEYIYYRNGQTFATLCYKRKKLVEIKDYRDLFGNILEIGTFNGKDGEWFLYDNKRNHTNSLIIKNGEIKKLKNSNGIVPEPISILIKKGIFFH